MGKLLSRAAFVGAVSLVSTLVSSGAVLAAPGWETPLDLQRALDQRWAESAAIAMHFGGRGSAVAAGDAQKAQPVVSPAASANPG